jgi:hypothetical protein
VLRLSYVLNLRVLRSAKYRVSPKTANADITPMNHMVSRGIELLPYFEAKKAQNPNKGFDLRQSNPAPTPDLAPVFRQQGSE